MINILITGANGFIGNKILEELIANNSKITAIIRRNSKVKINHKNLNYIFVDNLFKKDVNWWLKKLEGINCVIHSAWYTEPSKYLTSEKNFECLKGSLTILEAMKILNINYFVGIGTCFEYDFKYSNHPFTTSTPLNPKSPYTLAKVSLLNTLKLLEKSSDLKYAWCRVFFVYGEGEDKRRLFPYIHNMLRNSKKAYIKNGNLIRDYINVIDAGKLIAKLAFNNFHGEFNICSGKGQTIKDIAIGIGKKYNKKELIIFDNSKSEDNFPFKIIGKPTNFL